MNQPQAGVVKAFRAIDNAYDSAVKAGVPSYGDSIDLRDITLPNGMELKGEIAKTESSAGDDINYEVKARFIDPATHNDLSNAYITISQTEIIEAKDSTSPREKNLEPEKSIEIVNSVAAALRARFG